MVHTVSIGMHVLHCMHHVTLIPHCRSRSEVLAGAGHDSRAVPETCRSPAPSPSTRLQAGRPSGAAVAAVPLTHLASEGGVTAQPAACDTPSIATLIVHSTLQKPCLVDQWLFTHNTRYKNRGFGACKRQTL